MRTPLSSCIRILARGDGDRCMIEDPFSVRETLVPVLSGLVCDPVRETRDDEGEMSAGDANCGRTGVKGGSALLGMFERSED